MRAKITILISALLLSACGGSGGGSSSPAVNGPVLPDNYLEVTTACQSTPFTVGYVKILFAGAYDVYFFSTLADCEDPMPTTTSYCHIFTDGSFNQYCGPWHLDLSGTYPVDTPNQVIYYE